MLEGERRIRKDYFQQKSELLQLSAKCTSEHTGSQRKKMLWLVLKKWGNI